MNRKFLLGMIVLVLFIGAGYGASTNAGKVVLVRLLATESVVNKFEPPAKTNWKPEGVRTTGEVSETHGWQTTYARTIHTDTHSSDETPLAISPMFELDWITEPTMFVAEGPVFDREGNIYFSPIFPPEEVILISLEPKEGKRRWVFEGLSAGAGTPFIYSDTETGEDIIYVAAYDRVAALTVDGEVIYDRPSGLPKPDINTINGGHHNYGTSYHLQRDALISVMGDGHVLVVDRKSGKSLLKAPFLLPGAKTAVTNITLPKALRDAANRDFSPMYGGPEGSVEDRDPIGSVFHALYGELQQVTNFFSIDKNTGRIWIAASLPDEEDGKADGWSEIGALYGLDLEPDGEHSRLDVKFVVKFDGGTSSTPTISADGKKVYVADAFNHLFAISTETGEKIWSLEMPDLITGSLAVSSDNGEIYANVRNDIVKVFDKGDHGELSWTAEMNGFTPGRFQRNFKGLGSQIGANGIAFTGAVGIVRNNTQKLPFKLGAGLLDRETGRVRFFAGGAEDSVSSIVIGPDGEIYIGNSPLRRILARAVYGVSKSPEPPRGGVAKFKTVRFDLLIRDALWAAGTRADNAATIADERPNAAAQDIFQIKALIDQAMDAGPKAVEEGRLTTEDWSALRDQIASTRKDLSPTSADLSRSASMLLSLADEIGQL